jgi:hypothetical protein
LAKTIDDIYERQKRTVEASPVKFSISREDLKKGNYGNAWVMGRPNMLIGDLPQKPLTKEQAQAVARFLYDVLSVKEKKYE